VVRRTQDDTSTYRYRSYLPSTQPEAIFRPAVPRELDFANASTVLEPFQDTYDLLIRLELSQGLALQRLGLDLIELWVSRNKASAYAENRISSGREVKTD
jgi:hypothetical protein